MQSAMLRYDLPVCNCFVKSLLLATSPNYRQKVLIVLIIDLLPLASLALT